MSPPPELVAFLAGAVGAAVVTALMLWRRERVIRSRALDQSRAVLRGQLSEQVAPLMAGFDYVAADARFLGHPIDYVVFDGLSSDAETLELVFVEVKTGDARLTAREAAVRDAVRDGRVRFEVVRL